MNAEAKIFESRPIEKNGISNLKGRPLTLPRNGIDKELDVSTLSPREILERELVIERMEIINPHAVELDHAIVDQQHAAELNASMNKERGQLSAILVRAKMDEQGNVRYDVADGFHRASGMKAAGKNEILANVMYGCNDAELYDLRILSAGSVKSVQFARVANWMQDSFDLTPFAEKIKVTQAFAIAINDSQRTRGGTALSPEEIRGVKEWVKDRCDKWGKSPASAYQILRLVDLADPEIVKQVRNASGGSGRKGVITSEKLKHVVEKFPGKDNFHVQKLILEEVKNRQFSPTETGLLVLAFQKKYQPWMTDQDISIILSKIDISSIAKGGYSPSAPAIRRTPINIDEHRESKSRRDLRRRSSRQSSRNIYEKEATNEPPYANFSSSTEAHPEVLQIASNRIDKLNLEKQSLGEELIKTQQELAKATWWRNQELNLTPQERITMEIIIYERGTLDDVAKRLRIPSKEIAAVFASGIKKSRIK